jgi:DNA-binding transcriptional MerR regulator
MGFHQPESLYRRERHNGSMRIKNLIEQSGFPRETIHFYLREGLLPLPRKTKANQADYGPEHVQRLKLIKDLRERFFLPLTAIRKILDEQQGSELQVDHLTLKAEYFDPMSYLSQEELVGEKAFLDATGMSRERLADFEAQGIINPKRIKRRKVYSQDDVTIGRVIGDMRRLGLSTERGFSPVGIKNIRDHLKILVDLSVADFVETAQKIMTQEEAARMMNPAIDILAICCYHLVRRMFRESAENIQKAHFQPSGG